MSFDNTKEERNARVALGKELNSAYHEISNVEDGKFDDMLGRLGEIKEEIAKNEYHEAEKSLRKLKKNVKKEFGGSDAKRDAIVMSLDKTRNIMIGYLWNEPPSKNSE